jgi:predicted AlkP superfamily pyrophosphatase or phosphodiesterase
VSAASIENLAAMNRLLVLNVVGLDGALLAHAPRLAALARDGFAAPLGTVLPAVTTAAQTTFVTGKLPRDHGIVGNGWYFRDLSEVWLWRQSNRLVASESFVAEARRRDPSFRVAWLFWWYAMYGDFDVALTPRPAYHADGRKSGDVWTDPPELKAHLDATLGKFPLFDFWGPRAGLPSSVWIAKAAREVIAKHAPTACLVYLPHLDYDLQRFGPDDPRIPAQVAAIDRVASELIDHARGAGYRVVVLSEYGITAVRDAVPINRILRQEGYLRAQDNLVGELLDAGVSRAFAVADHQIAHVYVKDPRDVPAVKALLERQDGIERVLDEAGKREFGLDHPRAGELVAIAARDRWFSYYYWLDETKAPDFARTVEIHKKPGYDPLELLLDPRIAFPKLKIATTLARKALGFRYVLDVIPLDPTLIRGSHGRLPESDAKAPVLISDQRHLARDRFAATDVAAWLLDLIFDPR